MDSFASLFDLTDRLDWTLSDDETRVAEAALEDASELACLYGRPTWTKANAPRQLKTLILRSVVRYMRNPEGYIQSRAGDETVIWSDTRTPGGTFEFTADEQALIGQLAGRTKAFGSVPITAWGTNLRRGAGFVPVEGTGKPFPLFAEDEL